MVTLIVSREQMFSAGVLKMNGEQRTLKSVIGSAATCMCRPRWIVAAVLTVLALQLIAYVRLQCQAPTTSQTEYGIPERPEPVGWVFGRVIGVSGSPKSNLERSRFTPGPAGGPQRFAPQ